MQWKVAAPVAGEPFFTGEPLDRLTALSGLFVYKEASENANAKEKDKKTPPIPVWAPLEMSQIEGLKVLAEAVEDVDDGSALEKLRIFIFKYVKRLEIKFRKDEQSNNPRLPLCPTNLQPRDDRVHWEEGGKRFATDAFKYRHAQHFLLQDTERALSQLSFERERPDESMESLPMFFCKGT